MYSKLFFTQEVYENVILYGVQLVTESKPHYECIMSVLYQQDIVLSIRTPPLGTSSLCTQSEGLNVKVCNNTLLVFLII